MEDTTQKDQSTETPTLPDEGGADAGSTVSDTGTDTASPDNETLLKLKALEDKLHEAEKRIAGQTSSELDDIVGNEEKPKAQTSPPVTDPLVSRLSNLEVQVLESNYALQHPEKAFVFKDPDLKEKTEAEAVKIIQQENAEYGRMISKPDEIITKATERTIAFINKLREEGAKSVQSRLWKKEENLRQQNPI